MKKFIIVLLIVILSICVINAETDLFLNPGAYVPVLADSFPKTTATISYLSEQLAYLTGMIPTPAEIAARINHEELPIDPTDLASNAYIQNSPMISFYPRENISVTCDGENVRIFGIVNSKKKQHLISHISNMSDETLDQSSVSADSENRFNRLIKIPQTDDDLLQLSVYAGSRPYGEFESWVLNYIYLTRSEDGLWHFLPSPVYDGNIAMYEKDKSIKEALKNTPSLETDSAAVTSIANEQTADCSDDYERAAALHDWLCDYLYYDSDSVESGISIPYSSEDVIRSRKAVCLGFATLYASLCRSVEIPCNVVSGYALGVGSDTQWTEASAATSEQNHAWNEVYVGGRWIIVDPTWDCLNKIKDGEYIRSEESSHLYFDSNIDFFSANHKIIEYLKRW